MITYNSYFGVNSNNTALAVTKVVQSETTQPCLTSVLQHDERNGVNLVENVHWFTNKIKNSRIVPLNFSLVAETSNERCKGRTKLEHNEQFKLITQADYFQTGSGSSAVIAVQYTSFTNHHHGNYVKKSTQTSSLCLLRLLRVRVVLDESGPSLSHPQIYKHIRNAPYWIFGRYIICQYFTTHLADNQYGYSYLFMSQDYLVFSAAELKLSYSAYFL